MPRTVAFLRAINVGNRRVKMDILRQIFDSLGFARVETFIASGNVLFDAEQADTALLEKMIEQKLFQSLGYDVAAFVRTATELSAIVQYTPFSKLDLDGAAAFNIAFISKPLDTVQLQKLMTLKTPIDDFHVYGREIYWLCRKKQSESTFSNVVLEKTIGYQTTLRGASTLAKIVEKFNFANS